jgi:hypothetical protein
VDTDQLEENMQTTLILCGPQGIGKTRHASMLASLFGCGNIVDEWDGRDALPPGTLAITNADYVMQSGSIAIQVADLNGMNALIKGLQSSVS